MFYKRGNALTQLGGGLLATQAFGKVFGHDSLLTSIASHAVFNGLPNISMPKIPQARTPKAPGITTAMNVDQNKLNENINSLYKVSEASYKPQPRRSPMKKISAYDVKVVNDVVDNLRMTKTGELSYDQYLKKDAWNEMVFKPAGGAIKDFISYLGDKLRPKSPLMQLAESPIAKAAIPLAGLAALTGVGVAGLNSIIDRGSDAVKQHNSYKQMFNEFPELNEMPRTQVDKYWTVLENFAPKLTTNPLVAGQFISNMASYGMHGIDHNVVGQLAKIENDLTSGRSGMEQALVKNISNKAFEDALDTQLDM